MRISDWSSDVCSSDLKLLKEMGQPYTAHGFRSSFRDWVSEETNHPSDVAEAALAHIVANKTEAAYRRGNLLEAARDDGRMGRLFRRQNVIRPYTRARRPLPRHYERAVRSEEHTTETPSPNRNSYA